MKIIWKIVVGVVIVGTITLALLIISELFSPNKIEPTTVTTSIDWPLECQPEFAFTNQTPDQWIYPGSINIRDNKAATSDKVYQVVMCTEANSDEFIAMYKDLFSKEGFTFKDSSSKNGAYFYNWVKGDIDVLLNYKPLPNEIISYAFDIIR